MYQSNCTVISEKNQRSIKTEHAFDSFTLFHTDRRESDISRINYELACTLVYKSTF